MVRAHISGTFRTHGVNKMRINTCWANIEDKWPFFKVWWCIYIPKQGKYLLQLGDLRLVYILYIYQHNLAPVYLKASHRNLSLFEFPSVKTQNAHINEWMRARREVEKRSLRQLYVCTEPEFRSRDCVPLHGMPIKWQIYRINKCDIQTIRVKRDPKIEMKCKWKKRNSVTASSYYYYSSCCYIYTPKLCLENTRQNKYVLEWNSHTEGLKL